MRKLVLFHVPIFSVLLLGTAGCVPDIYLIDRQTVLELEASGQWPELDQKYKDAALKSGPTALEKTRDTPEARQIFTMTHDDKVEAKDSVKNSK